VIADFNAWMGLALIQARLGQAAGEVPVGAVLVDPTGTVLAAGFNQPISSQDPTAHAEVVVLREAARRLSNYRLPGTTMVVTVEPCLMCAGALANARVARVVYGAAEAKTGAFESILAFQSLRTNHRFEVIPGVRRDECAELMREFFQGKRDQS